jgi:hypothetical protein
MRVFFTLAALAVIAVTACTGVKAEEEPRYSVRILAVASDGVVIPATPTSTPTVVIVPTTTPTGPVVEAAHWNPDVERWRPLIASIFPAWAVSSALAIIQCESGGDPNATGAQGERGLFQVHPRWHPDSTYDPEGNVRAAYRISAGGQNWVAWSCSRVL